MIGLIIATLICIKHEVSSLMLNSVFVYDPWQFDMFKNCPKKLVDNKFLDPKHNVDFYFTKSVLSKKFDPFRTEKERADLFVIPVLCTQSTLGNCGNHSVNIKQLHDILSRSEYYLKSNGTNHLMVCDISERKEVTKNFPNVMIGIPVAFHEQSFISVGMTTFFSLPVFSNISSISKPLEKRKFDIVFAGQTAIKNEMQHMRGRDFYQHESLTKHIYFDRHLLWCDYVKLEEKPKNIFIYSPSDVCSKNGKELKFDHPQDSNRLKFSKFFEIAINSRMVLHLAGDEPTSDRFYNAFVSHTVIVLLSNNLQPVLDLLPFPHKIPWKDFFIVLDVDKFRKNPVLSLIELSKKVKNKDLMKRLSLMEKYKNEINWENENSNAHINLIEVAKKKINK